MKKRNPIIYTIEDLYKWACENKVEKYTVLIRDEGIPCNIDKDEIRIDEKDEWVYL